MLLKLIYVSFVGSGVFFPFGHSVTPMPFIAFASRVCMTFFLALALFKTLSFIWNEVERVHFFGIIRWLCGLPKNAVFNDHIVSVYVFPLLWRSFPYFQSNDSLTSPSKKKKKKKWWNLCTWINVHTNTHVSAVCFGKLFSTLMDRLCNKPPIVFQKARRLTIIFIDISTPNQFLCWNFLPEMRVSVDYTHGNGNSDNDDGLLSDCSMVTTNSMRRIIKF